MATTTEALSRARFRSDRTQRVNESVIREMTRLALEYKAVNLAQGFPDFPAPEVLKNAAREAITADINQYAITWGAKPFRDAIAAKYLRTYGLEIDPEREITVCCGSTEGMMASLLAVTNPGDELVIFEPYYENYGPDSLLCGATRKFVRLHAPDWTFDPDELRRAFSPRTKAIIINTPNNPTGCVFDLKSLELIAELCQEFDALAITDEIYEHILYDGAEHVPIMQLPGMRDRTILINSMSKTYAVTGWRVGWVLASPDLSHSIRKVHDFLTVGAAAPLQQAGAIALALPDDYYTAIAADYQGRRDTMLEVLEGAGFRCFHPRGAYYVMTDISGFGYPNDTEFVHHLIKDVGVAAVPGSSFFEDPRNGYGMIRFCFCKKYETLKEAQARLRKI
jgi:aspartate/methionine/tyrosine aminotransferase